ncbi:MAG: cadherin-like domain-containing protein [Bacteroidales bacterium]|nr:cadherin-like domain-containing protein [Bacteroidales bacterium]MBN2750524.1 cadherin-like domain-containing protein [Bacteroidales bacterium]
MNSRATHIVFIVLTLLLLKPSTMHGQQVPFSTNSNSLCIWDGSQYVPFFIKGTNLGVSIPGTFPGELAATRQDYAKWFTQIKAAGFNCIRLYTLHYPRFYEVLDSFNLANQHNPLLYIQGVWLNEQFNDYNNNLFNVTDSFRTEIAENVDCVHGNRFIPERQGKAYGLYKTDASKWCLAYIIGREVYPEEILTTNSSNSSITSFSGNHFSIDGVHGSEVWFTSNLDHLVAYESTNYQTQRPVSVSSWPTLDPLAHPEEPNTYEDLATIDLSGIVLKNAPAGFFISYHAYPYYPDFVSDQSDYFPYKDDYGPNSYKGYLTALKSHYQKHPLIIAEFGVPSSWGIAHFASSGMNHGGFDEYNQGLTNIRLLQTIEETGCGGGIQFAWIDEWFKRTWITDPLDYITESRALWHNLLSAEQNFGIVAFKSETNLRTLAQFPATENILEIKADANQAFFDLVVSLKNPMSIPDELWIALDTYSDSLGESLLPNNSPVPLRAEFALHLTNHSAELYVTEAYDTYGIWHNVSTPQQHYRSIVSDGAPWNIVRWKNNSEYSDVQFIGNLQVNYSFQNPSSKDGVTIFDDKIVVRIPWTLINVVAPNQLRVLHDNRETPEREDTLSSGINVGVLYQNQWYKTDQRFQWEKWNSIDRKTTKDTLKTSYFVMRDNLVLFNTPAIAVRDSFEFKDEYYPVFIDSDRGLLKNDFDLDGDYLAALIIEPTKNGQVILYNDGSFTYLPNENFNGKDTLKYCLYDGYSINTPNTVTLSVVNNNTSIENLAGYEEKVSAYPNPFTTDVTVKSLAPFSEISVFDLKGTCIARFKYTGKTKDLNLSHLNAGTYLLVVKLADEYHSVKIVKL